jgi:hypothetical protein
MESFACATGDDGLLLALFELTWYAPPHLQHHTLIGPLLYNLCFGTQIMCIYVVPLVLSCYTSMAGIASIFALSETNNTSKAKFFQFCEALINKYSNTCLCFNTSSFSFTDLGFRCQIIIFIFQISLW